MWFHVNTKSREQYVMEENWYSKLSVEDVKYLKVT